MELTDLFLAPLYLLLFYIILSRIKKKHYTGTPYEKYFLPAFTVKAIGAILSGLVYFFYYKSGDTLIYYYRITGINNLLHKSPLLGLKMIFADTSKYYPDISLLLELAKAFDTSSFMVVRIASLLSIFSFNSYTIIALFFSLFAFSGVWKLFLTFSRIQPELTTKFALACLFIPSVFFWGSGLFKDTLTLGALGWLTYSSARFFIFRERGLGQIISMLFFGYLIFVIKAYILLCFFPAMLFWIVLTYQSKVKNNFFRALLFPLVSILSIGMAYLALNQLGQQNTYWSINEIQDRAKDMQWWHKRVLELYGTEGGGGSNYSIGDGSFSISNLIKSFPVAVSVTFFGPPIWKVHNIPSLLSSIEGIFFLFLTIRAYFKVGLSWVFKLSMSNPFLFFLFFFSIAFAFAVGFTSFNYGALVRYKIPCLPFYLSAIFLIYHLKMKERRLLMSPEIKDS